MSKNVHFLYYFFLVFFVFSVSSGSVLLGQEKINVSVGAGLPELINLGLRYQFPQGQLGLSGGFLPVGEYSNLSVVGDLFYHFGGKSVFSERRPWYIRASLNYLRDESDYTIKKYWYLGPRIGRDINFSEKLGMGIDFGIAFQLSEKEIRKGRPSGWDLSPELPVLPSGGISFFYRF